MRDKLRYLIKAKYGMVSHKQDKKSFPDSHNYPWRSSLETFAYEAAVPCAPFRNTSAALRVLGCATEFRSNNILLEKKKEM